MLLIAMKPGKDGFCNQNKKLSAGGNSRRTAIIIDNEKNFPLDIDSD